MSLRDEMRGALSTLPNDAVKDVVIDKDSVFHGEPSTVVTVMLTDGRTVTGEFTTQAREGFGGVQFAHRKDIPALMRAKVDAVLHDRAERSER